MHSEVGVSLEKVREKAQSDGVSHEFTGIGDQLFRCASSCRCGFEIAPGKSLNMGIRIRTLLEVALIFHRGAGRGPDHVAKIIEQRAGHDGVQVHHTALFLCVRVQEHVVELGVIVRGPHREPSRGPGPFRASNDGLMLQEKLDFPRDMLGSIDAVLLQCPYKASKRLRTL